jgi:GDP-4-dehydro-6-deoxy-D-mannose reductase
VKKILVTGAAGFCGTHLCQTLEKSGAKVYGWARPRSSRRSSGVSSGGCTACVDVTDRATVDSFIRRVRPSEIYHLAALTIPQQSWQNEEKTMAVNVAGTVHLLDAIRRFSPGTRLLLASSNQAYGRTFLRGRKVREEACRMPDNPYGASKALAELACLDFYRAFKVEVVVARAFNHFGSGQTGPLVFSQWCRQIALIEKGRTPPLLKVGNLGVVREFLHVEDVVAAYILLMGKGGAGEIYNVCLGRPRKMSYYLNKLLGLAKVPVRAVPAPELLRDHEIPSVRGDSSKLKKLGWRPSRTVSDALAELLADWRRKIG